MTNNIVNIEFLPNISRLRDIVEEVIITYQDGRRYHAQIADKKEYYPQQISELVRLRLELECWLTLEDLPIQESLKDDNKTF